MDPTAMIRDMVDSDEAFRKQFDPSDPSFHGITAIPGVEKAVPTGGARVPESMGGEQCQNWRDLPEAPLEIEPEYPPEYHRAMANYETLGKVKKAISVLNKPVEICMKVRLQ